MRGPADEIADAMSEKTSHLPAAQSRARKQVCLDTSGIDGSRVCSLPQFFISAKSAPAPAPRCASRSIHRRRHGWNPLQFRPRAKNCFRRCSDGRNQLWLRTLDSPSARSLAGTDDGHYPFWSPRQPVDRVLLKCQMMRLDVDHGATQTLADAPTGKGRNMEPRCPSFCFTKRRFTDLSAYRRRECDPVPVTTQNANKSEVHSFPPIPS